MALKVVAEADAGRTELGGVPLIVSSEFFGVEFEDFDGVLGCFIEGSFALDDTLLVGLDCELDVELLDEALEEFDAKFVPLLCCCSLSRSFCFW